MKNVINISEFVFLKALALNHLFCVVFQAGCKSCMLAYTENENRTNGRKCNKGEKN